MGDEEKQLSELRPAFLSLYNSAVELMKALNDWSQM